jgi:hypothetical protein
LVIDSMPPATTMSCSPATMALAPYTTAFRPEPHTLLTVTAPTLSGTPAPIDAWPRGRLPDAGRQHAAHVHLADAAERVARDAGARERLLDGDGAQLGRGQRRQRALKRSDRCARGRDDDDVIHGCHGIIVPRRRRQPANS